MAAGGESEFLVQAATYLGAAAVSIPIFQRFKLGSILGYLAAGVIVGPFGLNLLHQEEGVFHVAELGVVLFLFVIGLELSLSRLWAMRNQIFGFGASQMALTGFVIASLFVAAGVMPVSSAIIAGLSLAFSSTAFALQLMKERGELNTVYGGRAFSILLFQDLAVIPLLAAIPFIAGSGGSEGAGWVSAAKAVGVVAALIFISRYLLDRIFRVVAGAGSREAFAATALLIVALTSLAVSWAGLSMALGAFLAGALLAESSYRHQIETDIEPFRGLLLGLFFISIGMRLDLSIIANSWWIVAGGALGLVAVKTLLLFGVTRVAGANNDEAMKTAAVLSQGGEFAFVVISLGVDALLFTNGQATLMSAIVTISMALTPLMVAVAQRLTSAEEGVPDGLEGPHEQQGHVLIVGFGRVGQIVSQVLYSSGATVTAIDKDPHHIRNAERYGFKVYYGDGARLDVLTTAGAFDSRAVILCMDDPKAVNQAVQVLRERSPNLVIIAVAHDRMHEIELRPLDVDVIVRETLESSLLMARETLSRMGHDDRIIDDYIEQFRKLDRERLLIQMDEGPEGAKHLLHQRFTKAADRTE